MRRTFVISIPSFIEGIQSHVWCVMIECDMATGGFGGGGGEGGGGVQGFANSFVLSVLSIPSFIEDFI